MEQRQKNFPVVFRWANGQVVDSIVTSDQLAAAGLPMPLSVTGAILYYQPAPGPWPATGEISISVDEGTAFYNAAKNYPVGQQNGPQDRLKLLAFVIINPHNTGNDQKHISSFDPPVIIRPGDSILIDHNATGDPGNYTVGLNFAWGIKYLVP